MDRRERQFARNDREILFGKAAVRERPVRLPVATPLYRLRRMRPCYFGPPTRRLFGVFDEPATGGASEVGVVLCYPYGPDYATAFRSFRILATRLARAGFHVLRFDYLGTGDSSGDVEDASIPQWIADVRTAVQELRGSLALREVSLVGLRLGATLAALAAAECQCVDRIVLWEPVVEGSEYLAAQQALHREWLDEALRDGQNARSADDDLLGYQLGDRLRQDFGTLSLWSLHRAPSRSVYLLSKGSLQEYDRLVEKLRECGARVEADRVEGPAVWSRTPSMDESSVPTRALQSIVNWLASASR